ncbi:hypothetical protein CHELA1G11_10064 [Hyphomicrobiales bacterium]|nr:hypothetical protein CHELA1G11_10064 [Hyphomicrobiales bacterium]CAH1677322.1 hypothetical protein CHELA1G2_14245 [Hyphomicrobiales bacterium]
MPLELSRYRRQYPVVAQGWPLVLLIYNTTSASPTPPMGAVPGAAQPAGQSFAGVGAPLGGAAAGAGAGHEY